MSDFTYDSLTKQRKHYIDAIIEHGEDIGIDLSKDTYCRAELRRISMSLKGKKWIPNWITHDHARRAGVGVFHLPEVQEKYLAYQEGNIPVLTEEEEKIRAREAKKAEMKRRLEAEINEEVEEEIAW